MSTTQTLSVLSAGNADDTPLWCLFWGVEICARAREDKLAFSGDQTHKLPHLGQKCVSAQRGLLQRADLYSR